MALSPESDPTPSTSTSLQRAVSLLGLQGHLSGGRTPHHNFLGSVSSRMPFSLSKPSFNLLWAQLEPKATPYLSSGLTWSGVRSGEQVWSTLGDRGESGRGQGSRPGTGPAAPGLSGTVPPCPCTAEAGRIPYRVGQAAESRGRLLHGAVRHDSHVQGCHDDYG